MRVISKFIDMRKYYLNLSLLLLGILSSLTGCREKIDLTDIDTRSEINVGVALPMGTLHASLDGIMKTNALGSNFYLNEDGILTYRDTTQFDMSMVAKDWAKYIKKTHKNFHIDEPITIPGPIDYTFAFDFNLDMSQANIDTEKERFDSLLLDYMGLNSTLNVRNINFPWDWVKDVTIDLGPQCYREAGQMITVYEQGANAGFGTPIYTLIDNFSICLMKDRTLNPYTNTLEEFKHNVVDTVLMKLSFTVSVPQGESLVIGNDAAIEYDLEFEDLQYSAIWGYFQTDKELALKDTLKITEGWNIGEYISSMRLPFSAPKLELSITTQISAYWELLINSLFSRKLATGEQASATFDGQTSCKKVFDDQIGFDPSSIGEEANFTLTFDNSEANGHLDNLFKISPDELIYDLAFNLANPEAHPQMRIPAEPGIHVDMFATLPMAFYQDVLITYKDTLKDINLSVIDFESLAENDSPIEDIKKATVYLIVKAQNEFPFSVKGTFHFLDEQGESLPIIDTPVQLAANDSTKQVFEFHEEDFNQLAKTKSVVIELEADDQLTKDKPDLYPICLKGEQGATVSLGLAGNVNAVFNFDKE